MSHELLFFGGFILFIILMLAIDLDLFAKGNKTISLKFATIMSLVWISFALGFGIFLYFWWLELLSIFAIVKLKDVVHRHSQHICVG